MKIEMHRALGWDGFKVAMTDVELLTHIQYPDIVQLPFSDTNILGGGMKTLANL